MADFKKKSTGRKGASTTSSNRNGSGYGKRNDSTKEKSSFGEKKAGGGFGKDTKRFGTDKPQYEKKRSFGGDSDKPRFEKRSFGGNSDKPQYEKKRSFGGDSDKPRFEKRSFGGDLDKPKFEKRSFGGNSDKSQYEKKRSFGGDSDKPKFEKRSFGGNSDKPQYEKKRSFGGDSDKPKFEKRSFGGDSDKPRFEKRSFGGDSDKPRFEKRSFGGDSDKPKFEKRSFGGDSDKPKFEKRSFGGDSDKPRFEKRSFGGDSDKPQEEKKRRFGFSKQERPSFEPLIEEKKKNTHTKKAIGDTHTIRLNRFIANAGICSRREADELIASGQVVVNGVVVTEMGYQVQTTDDIRYQGEKLNREALVYVLLNKPKDHITTTDDPEGRKTVMNLVRQVGDERIYPVGRLDRNTTGLLLLTNDGKLADKLSHPSSNIHKVYEVLLEKPIEESDLQKLLEGVELEDGFSRADKVSAVTPDGLVVSITIHSGKNRVVRRMFAHLGYEVMKLDRTHYAGLTKKGLGRGSWRLLTQQEVLRLKHFTS
jgi:23S rRNA pseudouridine2605 synthase